MSRTLKTTIQMNMQHTKNPTAAYRPFGVIKRGTTCTLIRHIPATDDESNNATWQGKHPGWNEVQFSHGVETLRADLFATT
jgi:hypothetical protein